MPHCWCSLFLFLSFSISYKINFYAVIHWPDSRTVSASTSPKWPSTLCYLYLSYRSDKGSFTAKLVLLLAETDLTIYMTWPDLTTPLPNTLSGRTYIAARWGYTMHKVEAFGDQAFVGGARAITWWSSTSQIGQGERARAIIGLLLYTCHPSSLQTILILSVRKQVKQIWTHRYTRKARSVRLLF